LVEPSTGSNTLISKLFLTIDLTEKVLEEAITSKANLIISYHPPIFTPFKRLIQSDTKQRIIVRAIEEKLSIYSPHTIADAVDDGVNDWLSKGLGEHESIEPIEPAFFQDPNQSCKLIIFTPQSHAERMIKELGKVEGIATIGNYNYCTFSLEGKGSFLGNENSNPVVGSRMNMETVSEVRLEMVCNRFQLDRASKIIRQYHPYETPAWEVIPLEPLPMKNTGQGRLVTLKEKIPLSELLDRLKRHLGLSYIRFALPHNVQANTFLLKSVAICAGSGAMVLEGVYADVLLTGEMRHHEILAATARGAAVVLCEHAASERGYLSAVLCNTLQTLFADIPALTVLVASSDQDPLQLRHWLSPDK